MAKQSTKPDGKSSFAGVTKPIMPKNEVLGKIKNARLIKPEPRNDNQHAYIDSLWEGKPLTIAEGPAGTGKTYLAAIVAAAKLGDGSIDSIVITSPAVGAGNSLGFRPGDVFEKMKGWVAPITDTLSEIYGSMTVRAMYDLDILKLVPFEDLRGRSFNNSFVIADECQNLTPQQMKLFLTRSHEGSQTVIMGDMSQKDISGESGFEDLKNRIKHNPNPTLASSIVFSPDDVVRSKLCKYVVGIYDAPKPMVPSPHP